MAARIGTDTESGMIQAVVVKAANVNNSTQGHQLLHGVDRVVFEYAGFRDTMKPPEATGVHWQVGVCLDERRALDVMRESHRMVNEVESFNTSVPAKVEHELSVNRLQFRFTKARHLGVKQNRAQLKTRLALQNPWIVRRNLMTAMV